MEQFLIVLIVLTTLSFIFMVYGIVEEYIQKQKSEKLHKSLLDFEESLNDFAIKNLEEKNKVQGIKKITKKPKTTTDMIKVKGKTQVVKRNTKGHFAK